MKITCRLPGVRYEWYSSSNYAKTFIICFSIFLLGYLMNFQNIWEYRKEFYQFYQWLSYQTGFISAPVQWNCTELMSSIFGIFFSPVGAVTGWIF